MAPDREQAGVRLADVALREGQVADLFDGGDGVAVLGQPHRPAIDGGVGIPEHLCGSGDLVAGEAGDLDHLIPVDRLHMVTPCVEAAGAIGDEVAVQHGAHVADGDFALVAGQFFPEDRTNLFCA